MIGDRRVSKTWPGPPQPTVAVHVPTFRRAEFLPELVACLEAQTYPRDRFEVAIVDDASGDAAWRDLRDLVDRTPLRMVALRQADNAGAAAARNAAVAATRGELLAFTDDDCLPTPSWIERLVAAAEGADVVQGRTEPDPRPGTGPWARSIRIVEPTPLFETCNIAYRRRAFAAAGGFDERNAVSDRAGEHPFGEDTLLGAAVVAAGGRRAFAADSVVHHRNLDASYADHLRGMRELDGFPALVRQSEVLRDALVAGTFLSRRTAAFDLAVLAAAAAFLRRRPLLLAGVVPWAVQTWPATREHGGRPRAVRLAQLGLGDAVGLLALVQGSLRHRRVVL